MTTGIGRLAAITVLALASMVTPAGPDTTTPVAWQLLDDGDPDRVPWVNVVYDPARDVAIRISPGLGDGPELIWELGSDNDWHRRRFEGGSPRQTGAWCSAWDSDRGVMVVGGGDPGETWEYDGLSWTQVITVVSPGLRRICMMAYDSDAGRIVLFGGADENWDATGETWEYDGTNWSLIPTSESPPARLEGAMTYLPSDRRVVLFGGEGLNGNLLGDTWEYDTSRSRWRQVTPQDSPPTAKGSGMAYDPVREVAVLFGGYSFDATQGGYYVHDETWEWDGRRWAPLETSEAPPARLRMALYFDSARGRIRGHGGEPGDTSFDDTWEFDGSSWTEVVAQPVIPENRYHAPNAYDPRSESVVLYGGSGSDGALYSDTWRFVDATWVLDPGAGSATASNRFGLVYDPGVDRLVGFAGYDGTSVFPEELHEYEGGVPGWVSIPTSGPPGRSGHSWVHAPAAGGTVLFGGLLESYGRSDDTWILSGYQWEQVFSPVSPSSREYAAMAYVPSSGEVLLYGGWLEVGGSNPSDETWSFKDGEWTLVAKPSSPGSRRLPRMAYDPTREVVVLFGDGPWDERVTWEFDGTSWIARDTPFLPEPIRWSPVFVWDDRNEVILLFGGRKGPDLNDTWAYGADPDEDGIVGGLDNCRQVVNANQANGDGDPAGDACDCAAADPGSFLAPVEVGGVIVSGGETSSLAWIDQAPSVGSDVRYDVVSGALSALRSTGSFDAASCLAGGLVSPETTDDRPVPLHDGFYYLVRATNVCGQGTYGHDRVGLDSHCP